MMGADKCIRLSELHNPDHLSAAAFNDAPTTTILFRQQIAQVVRSYRSVTSTRILCSNLDDCVQDKSNYWFSKLYFRYPNGTLQAGALEFSIHFFCQPHANQRSRQWATEDCWYTTKIVAVMTFPMADRVLKLSHQVLR